MGIVASHEHQEGKPDELLAPEQFPGMNKAFYATRPWSYFRHRERLLGIWRETGVARGLDEPEYTEVVRRLNDGQDSGIFTDRMNMELL